MDRCRECGDRKPLGADGRCRWRGGCEHRQFRHRAAMARGNALLAQLDPPAPLPRRRGWQDQAFDYWHNLPE